MGPIKIQFVLFHCQVLIKMIHIVIFVILVITKIDLVYLCHFVNPVLYSAFLK